MAQDKKQKVLLAVLAVVALGAGSYFVFLRDSAPAATTGMSTEPGQRRERKETVDSASKRREVARRAPTERAEPVRREREEIEAPTGTRRERRREKTEIQKKKLSPAA